MATWDGKSKGGALGYRIFGWSIRYLGLDFAYFLLYFVSAWFMFASGNAFRGIWYFFHSRFGYGKVKTLCSIYRSYYLFGQGIIDKAAVLAGFNHKLTFGLEGREHLLRMVDGGIIISGHFGNWEVGGQLLDVPGKKIHIVVLDSEKESIRNYMSDVLANRNVNVITIRNDFSHMFEMKEALANREIIALHGDRYINGNKTVAIPFLGEPAHFPLGPWQIARYFNKPVSYVFAVKETRRKYMFYATPLTMMAEADNYRERDETLVPSMKEYVSVLEDMVRKYPLQWHNYYDFWKQEGGS
jgi:predicted LPLAT superfamily acyltransferase